MITAFVGGLAFGVTGVAIAYSASNLLISLPFTFYMAGRTGPVNTRDLWSAAAGQLPLFFVVVIVTWLVRLWIQPTLEVPLAYSQWLRSPLHGARQRPGYADSGAQERVNDATHKTASHSTSSQNESPGFVDPGYFVGKPKSSISDAVTGLVDTK